MHTLITHARRGISDPGTEIARDTWDMVLFGHRGNLSFTAITQPWLRETAKIWALADLPRRRGRHGGDKTRHYLSSLAFLSASLRQRADHGEDPATLGRQDIELFLNRLGYLHAAGVLRLHPDRPAVGLHHGNRGVAMADQRPAADHHKQHAAQSAGDHCQPACGRIHALAVAGDAVGWTGDTEIV